MRKTDAGERNRRAGLGDTEPAPVRECAPWGSPEEPEGLCVVCSSDTNPFESGTLVLGLTDRNLSGGALSTELCSEQTCDEASRAKEAAGPAGDRTGSAVTVGDSGLDAGGRIPTALMCLWVSGTPAPCQFS